MRMRAKKSKKRAFKFERKGVARLSSGQDEKGPQKGEASKKVFRRRKGVGPLSSWR